MDDMPLRPLSSDRQRAALLVSSETDVVRFLVDARALAAVAVCTVKSTVAVVHCVV